MFFGIQLTPGHLIVAVGLVVLYDALWTWVFKDETAAWWFARLQAYLKAGVYAGILGFGVLVAYTPWPWNLILALSAIVSVFSISAWLKKRAPKTEKKK